MNFIIVLDQDFERNNISYLNIITQNIKKFYSKSKINLLLFQKELEKSLLIDKEDYSDIFYVYNRSIIKHIKKIKCDTKKNIIINLNNKYFSKIINFLIFTKNKITHDFLIKNDNHLKIDHENEIKSKLSQIFIEKCLIIKPLIVEEKNKIKKTEKIINWNLTSSELNKLNEIKFIFFYLKGQNVNDYKNDILKVANLLSNKANLKMIITARIDNFNLKEYINDQEIYENIIDNFLIYDNKNFVLNFSKYAKLIITNDKTLNNYNNHKGNKSIIIDKQIIKNKSVFKFKDKLLFDKKIDRISKFEKSIEYLVNMI